MCLDALLEFSALLHDFKKVSEGDGVRRFWVDKKHRRALGALSRGSVDYVESVLLQVGECCFDIDNAKGDVGHAAATRVLRQLPGGRRGRAERFEQLDPIRAVTYLQQHLPHQIISQHVFTMQFGEAHQFIGVYVPFQFARQHCDGDVVDA
jgi:hypothetical protein